MIPAKNNIIVKINSSKPTEYSILNPISGSFDIMNEEEYTMLKNLETSTDTDDQFVSYLLERGYAYENRKTQEEVIDKAYREFQSEVEDSQTQLMLVPTYGCNLACTYCFQHGIDGRPALISKETVDAFFEYARCNFANNKIKPFITLFGGEPLVNSKAQREIISYIIDKCVEGDYEIAAVTNGYDLYEYIDILKKAKVKEIQITLDGSRDVHDTRRATANKKGTFDRIITGMEAAIKEKMPINLRSVVDSENIADLVNLAEFLDKKGWLDLPPERFKTQLGRNYELFECYAKPQHLMTQTELWGEFALSSREHPVLAKFHRPDFKGIRHLVDTGEMYMASFDTCPACKTEWVFDLYGEIYGCTASCGREEYSLGTYWPEVNLNKKAIEIWQKRDVTTIEKCRSCKYDVICGGGCGVVAANLNNGEILSPDCRPIQDLIDIGVNHYIADIRNMMEDSGKEGATVEEIGCRCEIEPPASSCCCGVDAAKEASACCIPQVKEVSSINMSKNTAGCILCGSELVYTTAPHTETCELCNKSFTANVKCSQGHYVCDSCHSMDILGKVEQLLANSTSEDPVELAENIFSLSELNMHGPEYHSITPAVLVTAYQNLSGSRDLSKIREAIRRGKDTKGGSCGYNGSCGAGVGSGVAVSIIEGATPMSKTIRGNANLATAYALLEIGKYGGPRCCKRDSMLSIESFIKSTDYFRDLLKKNHVCKQYKRNKDCLGIRCPYFPVKR